MDCLINEKEGVCLYICEEQEVWQTVEVSIRDLLSNITVADLAKRQVSLAGQAALPL